jgi:uncharacterized protein YfdQ (DUF2303 family)
MALPNEPVNANEARTHTRLLLDTGMAMAKPIKNPDPHGDHFVIVPEGHKVEALPRRPSPDHPSTTVKLRDATSFIYYVATHKGMWSRIYATVDPALFLAVFDDHAGDSFVPLQDRAAWREFRAEFKVPASREWVLWHAANRKDMSQLGFAEFLQDNLPDVFDPDGATLLDMALNFEQSSKGNFVATQRLQDGSHRLEWRDEKESGTFKMPEHITLRIPVFENEAPRDLTARLKYRVKEGVLSLRYELVRSHKVLEEAFRDAWSRIATETQVPILLGSPE